MTKVIKVKDRTFEYLVTIGKWSDTMDDIIWKLVQSYSKSVSMVEYKDLNKVEGI